MWLSHANQLFTLLFLIGYGYICFVSEFITKNEPLRTKIREIHFD